MSLTIKEKIKTVFKLLVEPKVLFALISYRSFGYLLETGWFYTFKSGQPVDADKKAIPWFTYSAIDFLKERLNSNLNVLEFGSGNSTLFLAKKVKKVTALEHDDGWFQNILAKKTSNIEIKFVSAGRAKDYLQPLVENEKFDVIIIDGLFRNECIKASLKNLSEVGVIILDDSERNEYTEGITFLLKNGFQKINFSGIAPGIFFRKCTTIFYNDLNCVNI